MNQSPAHLFRIAIILTSALFGLLVAQSLGSYFPKQYRSSVTLQIKQIQNPSSFGDSRVPSQEFLAREFQYIQSKENLYPIMDSLQLEKRWAKASVPSTKENTYQSLTARLRISEIRNTELIQISVTSTDPNEAAEIANAIAFEYSRHRDAIQMEALTRSIKLQQDAIERQQKTVDELRKIAATIRSQESESDRNSGLLNESLEPTAGSPKYIEAQKNFLQAKKLLEELEVKLQTEMVNTAMPMKPAMIWEKAEPSAISISTRPAIRLALGALLGAIAGFLLSLLIRK